MQMRQAMDCSGGRELKSLFLASCSRGPAESRRSPTGMMMIRYVVIALLVIAVVSNGVIATRLASPYALTVSYRDGTPAWEQWIHRTLTGKVHHIRTVRYYPTGEILFSTVNLSRAGLVCTGDATERCSRTVLAGSRTTQTSC